MEAVNYANALRRDLPATSLPYVESSAARGRVRRVEAVELCGGLSSDWWGPAKDGTDSHLPAGTSRNPNGVLVRKCVVIPASALDMVGLRRESAYLKQHVVIARFLNALPENVRHSEWIRELEDKIRARVALHREAGGGFFFIKLDTLELVSRVLDLTPCKLRAGTAIFQRWCPTFNPCQPTGLVIPSWITLKNLPLEFHEREARTLAKSVGTILEEDRSDMAKGDPRFCVGIDPSGGFVSRISVANVAGHFSEVTVEYEVRDNPCRYCSGVGHDEDLCSSRGICDPLRFPPTGTQTRGRILSQTEESVTKNGRRSSITLKLRILVVPHPRQAKQLTRTGFN